MGLLKLPCGTFKIVLTNETVWDFLVIVPEIYPFYLGSQINRDISYNV